MLRFSPNKFAKKMSRDLGINEVKCRRVMRYFRKEITKMFIENDEVSFLGIFKIRYYFRKGGYIVMNNPDWIASDTHTLKCKPYRSFRNKLKAFKLGEKDEPEDQSTQRWINEAASANKRISGD
jgi:hypothetical protein